MISAKKTAKKMEAEVIMVRRLFRHRFRQANFKLFISMVLAYSFHILLGEETVFYGCIKLNLFDFHNGKLSLFFLRNNLQDSIFRIQAASSFLRKFTDTTLEIPLCSIVMPNSISANSMVRLLWVMTTI